MTRPEPETAVLVEYLQAASRGTNALATKLQGGVRSLEDERQYADYLVELANMLRVHASMHEEQQHPSAQIHYISDCHRTPTPELAMFGDLLGGLGELVHHFSRRFIEVSAQARHRRPPDDPPPEAA